MTVDGAIRPLDGSDEAEACARMMVSSEPWITLRRGYDDALRVLRDPSREVHLRVDGEHILGFIVLALEGPFTGYIQTVCGHCTNGSATRWWASCPAMSTGITRRS